MPDPADPTTLQQLLFETVEGFEELAILVWFHGHGEGSDGDAEGVARGVSLSPDMADTALGSLAARGLLSVSASHPKRFVYAPSPPLRDAVDRIAFEYSTNPVQVMRLMTANAIDRVRTAALKTFAECFRVRGPER